MSDISPAKVRSLIADFFSSIGACEVATMFEVKIKVMLVDDCYRPIKASEILSLARENPLLGLSSAPETQITDADDYAIKLKDAAAALFRQRYCRGRTAPVSPAVAIVISQNHAVNMFIEEDGQGRNRIRFLDASLPELPVTGVPAMAASMMKQPPVKLIYM